MAINLTGKRVSFPDIHREGSLPVLDRWWDSKLTLPFLSELEYILELQAKDNNNKQYG